MPDPRGFLSVKRSGAPTRPTDSRVGDWESVYESLDPVVRNRDVAAQASRCMDCAVPYCHSAGVGCPLGNLIPEWNDLVRRGRWSEASENLHSTNNFPEFTGHLCPAPCETACVLALDNERTSGGVTIKRIEQAIVDNAWESGSLGPRAPAVHSGHRVAVVGSGPAGLAAAQQLTRAGHRVTVFERSDRIGGLLRYGIPEFKLPKALINRRLAQLIAEGTRFVTGCAVGVDVSAQDLMTDFEAIVLAVGADRARDTDVPGRGLRGIHLAMKYLRAANRECEGDGASSISARGENVVIIGGGDTAADCLGTVHRQGPRSVTELDYHVPPPGHRDRDRDPWPLWPRVLRSSPADDEGSDKRFRWAAQEFLDDGDGAVCAIRMVPVAVSRGENGQRTLVQTGDTTDLVCEMVLLALGFDGVETAPLLTDLDVGTDPLGRIECDVGWQTRTPGVFVCGDAHRGASLVVWAIAEGRSAAHAVDVYLTGGSDLPSPVHPKAFPLFVR
ncbi:glutamate synthase subunit beta [Rhodococcus sp. IEGM 1409]|uniref:glutamate synthase subunit beta n=1 Tax=Rhodococcus sp. IEGM 1409 TaxID=3047082 RepID=UPI0024B6A224|nr:glutamate synthase subunit beta [Rhodococcus sp. IEGM 1409]MDI9903054.1 glutamate synthase subunit beta [Rhodococcus sp. IEGM 1409]